MLDRPVWEALSTHHSALAVGSPLARRYANDVNLFASASDDSAAALTALADLVPAGERVFVLQVPNILVPVGLVPVKEAKGVQMIATRHIQAETSEDTILELADADIPEMLALAKLTEPGPFLARTPKMGRFLGIRIGGQLASMAGERFRLPGYTEVSGICTHPAFRGRGLARKLSAAITTLIQSRGEQAFLHAWRTNLPAISLYQSLGFEIRTEVDVKVLERANSFARPIED